MKDFSQIEDSILDSGEMVKKAGRALIENMGKIIALAVSLIMIAVTFTDISFSSVFTESFASSLLLLLTSSYIIYFSLEDAGEKCAENTEEYKKAKERYDSLRQKVSGNDIADLRVFCLGYSERELEYRKSNALIREGLSSEDMKAFCSGKTFDKRTGRKLKRIAKIKPVRLTPRMLLSKGKAGRSGELENPESKKLLSLIIKLIPSTVCMTVTVSVMLSAKEGLSSADVLNGILKLSALPMIGFKGYSAGYSYAKHSLASWFETKADIIEDFLKSKG
ncbi:MAG: hypothetical protein IJY23_06640 [Clostridia bacterium]|nr:hypothetical protein [Clostridia bacterium]